MKITPNEIVKLEPNEIFVFGSNTAGRHQGGAAAFARRQFGAVMGVGEGLTGQSYALPTANPQFQGLPLDVIFGHVLKFIIYARHNPDKTFYVTKVGCGIAGFSISEIAPLFKEALDAPNIALPQEFIDEILEA